MSNPPISTQTPPSSSSSPLNPDYRKGNWTLQETLTLITAKRLDDARRSEPKQNPLPSPATGRSSELRWKWIENYCCAHGCIRSQNQCNDKWDNLLRDFKKVTHYESEPDKPKPYWEMERAERKEKGLPSNFGVEVFEALRDVVGRRKECRLMSRRVFVPVSLSSQQQQQQQQQKVEAVEKVAAEEPPALEVPSAEPAVTRQATVPPPSTPRAPDTSETSDSGQAADTAEPDPKRQKIQDTGSSLIEGASMIARTLLSCEEKREKRHRDLIQLQERRLRLESDRIELNRQGFAGLISAISSLSSAIHAVSHRDNQDNGDAS